MRKTIFILFGLFASIITNSQTGQLCCGFECGISGTGSHVDLPVGTQSFSTSTVRTGNRSLRLNPTASNSYFVSASLTSSDKWVARFFIRFATLPSADCALIALGSSSKGGAWFQQSDSKIYARAGSATANGATGVSVTTGQWYQIDVYLNSNANPWTCDVKVNGTACGQATNSAAGSSGTLLYVGNANGTATMDAFYDDLIITQGGADYPIGDGNVYAFVPTSDGTHNIAGAADFKRGAAGTDILNSTTDSYLLVDDIPLDAIGSAPTSNDYINAIAPPNATDYTENKFGVATGSSNPGTAPRLIDVLVETAQSATQTGSFKLNLLDNATTDVIKEQVGIAGATNVACWRKAYATPPSGGSWNGGSSGNGAFNNLRVRFYSADPAPDQYFVAGMIEAEFAPDNLTVPGTPSDKRHTLLGVGEPVANINKQFFKNKILSR